MRWKKLNGVSRRGRVLVTVRLALTSESEVTPIQTNDSMTENKSISCAAQGLLTQQRAQVDTTFSNAN